MLACKAFATLFGRGGQGQCRQHQSDRSSDQSLAQLSPQHFQNHCWLAEYQVSIRLTLPNGRAVNVARTPKEDERYADLNFAISDAFKRARRQLQDEARPMRGDVKHHAQR